MKYAHFIKLTVFSYEDENKHSILNAFLKLFPFSLDDNKIALKKSKAVGFNEREINIFEVQLIKSNLVNQFLQSLLARLKTEEKYQIMSQISSRLDKGLNFYLRFEKESWIKRNELVLTDSGKCFHIKISMAAFPRKMEVALNLVKELFS